MNQDSHMYRGASWSILIHV